LTRLSIDLPFTVIVYADGFFGVAEATNVHDVHIYNYGTLAHIRNLTLFNGGELWLHDGSQTQLGGVNHGRNVFEFEYVLVEDRGAIRCYHDPVSEQSMTFTAIDVDIEGGGMIHGTNLTFIAEEVDIQAGGEISATGRGYRPTDIKNAEGFYEIDTNVGRGVDGPGASGAGHGMFLHISYGLGRLTDTRF
jgi:hypothetical protein